MKEIPKFNEFINESVDYLYVKYFIAKDKNWYIVIIDEYDRENPTTIYHGPFDSINDAQRYYQNKYPNSGSYSTNTRGTENVPKVLNKYI